MVTAVSPEGNTWQEKVRVSGDQVIVEIKLAGAPGPASTEAFDGSAAAVAAALADVKAAGGYVAWVLEKKAFGFHDVQLTVSLQRAQTALKRQADKLKDLRAPDALLGRAREELARAVEEAMQFATLLSDAVTTAQQEGTALGKAAQLRAQALAHVPLMALDSGSLGPLHGSEAFRHALPPDRWPSVGLVPDAQDFQLGAEYDGDQPPRVGTVTKGGVADVLGLRPGDRVLNVEGRPVQDGWGLKLALRAAAGRTVRIELARDGKPETRRVMVPASLLR
jgi:hypothetical protein